MCLLGSELNCIFHWNAHLLIMDKSLLRSLWDSSLSNTLEKIGVSSANNLQIDLRPFGHLSLSLM